ncbi:hypothetical protein [Listeria booriae]|uniref:Uncharacterized protein n=1 Tax=Listeria booriae TaxID=1552123 RepID=A0A099W6N8_9LIST|nr:hypothetical protein [Listeria booriae]KGL40426.1 hypothetical protein EP57_11070 [Listeria booriae]MBC1225835.1 hypothetical protein [Listeria booriae]MBC1306300.1 hypothetical protein [Listeria booriae]MBC1356933.1 hypothetical protein [Listeria booriae]MBC1552329.1 hypothetical protein [Listeria booriae]
MKKQVEKIIFGIIYGFSAIFFLGFIVNIVHGFIIHMHETDSWRAVLRILASPVTDPAIFQVHVGNNIWSMFLAIIISYVLPAFFCVSTYFLKQDYLETHENSRFLH